MLDMPLADGVGKSSYKPVKAPDTAPDPAPARGGYVDLSEEDNSPAGAPSISNIPEITPTETPEPETAMDTDPETEPDEDADEPPVISGGDPLEEKRNRAFSYYVNYYNVPVIQPPEETEETESDEELIAAYLSSDEAAREQAIADLEAAGINPQDVAAFLAGNADSVDAEVNRQLQISLTGDNPDTEESDFIEDVAILGKWTAPAVDWLVEEASQAVDWAAGGVASWVIGEEVTVNSHISHDEQAAMVQNQLDQYHANIDAMQNVQDWDVLYALYEDNQQILTDIDEDLGNAHVESVLEGAVGNLVGLPLLAIGSLTGCSPTTTATDPAGGASGTQPALQPLATATPDYAANAQLLYDYAVQVQSDPTYTTDVAKMQAVLTQAATLSGGDADLFMQLTNEVFFGENANAGGNMESAAVVNNTTMALSPVSFGDTGAADIYRDGSNVQLNHHYYAFVNLGYNNPEWVGNNMAWYHDHNLFNVDSPGGVSAEDYRLSILGVQMGQNLRNGTWTPADFASNFDEYVGTEDYNTVTEEQIEFLNLPPAAGGPNATP